MMPAVPRRIPPPSLAIGLVLALLAGASEQENWQRLRSMPLERRVMLAKRLEEFDRLSRDEKAEIRTLDEKLAALPPADQANYRAVLRRYHLWLETLTADQRKELSAAPLDQKMMLVERFRAEQAKDRDGGAIPLVFQLADLRGRSPFELAHLLQIWFALSPAQRAEVEKAGVRDRIPKLRELGRQVKVPAQGQLTKAQEEAVLKQMDRSITKGVLRAQLKKAESEKPILDRRRLAVNYYFLANPPRPVEAVNLFQFESAMPSWLRATFDHLPPEEAKRRLTILYRLIYPAGTEIPAPRAKPSEAPGAPARPAAPAPPAAPSAGQATPPPL